MCAPGARAGPGRSGAAGAPLRLRPGRTARSAGAGHDVGLRAGDRGRDGRGGGGFRLPCGASR
eukprot:6124595-Lingulodinium_polyedra.AAC.1